MSVLKRNRKESQFEVYHNWYKVRREITALMIEDFGFVKDRQLKKLLRRFGAGSEEELTEEQMERYRIKKTRILQIAAWYLDNQKTCILDCIRNVTEEIFVANSIFPTCPEELTERRLHQDRAVGQCFRLKQELQYIVETLEVDLNKYMRPSEMIDAEIALIKAWRKSDNKFRKAFT